MDKGTKNLMGTLIPKWIALLILLTVIIVSPILLTVIIGYLK